jgi:hypothetical protein
MKKIIGGMTVLGLISGCASITQGSLQDVQVSTDSPVPVTCGAKNSRGHWKSNASPDTITVFRSKSDLAIRCEGNGYAGEAVNPSNLEIASLGNLPLGGIWAIVDASTGAMFGYDNAIRVPVTARQTAILNDSKLTPVDNRCAIFRADYGNYYQYGDLVDCGAIVNWSAPTKHLVTAPITK